MKKIRAFFPAIIVVFLLLAVWEIYARLSSVSETFLPAPSSVLQALFNYRALLWQNAVPTLIETVVGLLLAIVLGVAVAVAIFWSTRVRRALYPLLVVSQTIPLIALAPLLLLWFGFNLTPKIIIVVLFCFFPITVAVSDGLLNTPKHLDDLFSSWKVSRWQRLRYLHFPAALDSFFSGLKISTTYAVTGAIVGEYVGAYQGIGIYMQSAAHARATSVVFAAIIVVILLTLVLLSCVIALQRFVMPWKYIHEK